MCQALWFVVVAIAIGTCAPRVQCQFNNNASSGSHEWIPKGHTHLRPQDWDVAPFKWHLLREMAVEIGDKSSQENRSRIWAHFHNVAGEDLKSKGDDERAAEISKFVKRVHHVKKIDMPVSELLTKEWFEKKKVYDNQVIVSMEDDMIVENAALYLYKKHPEMSAIVKWNPTTETFDHVVGTTEKLGSESRIQVVGHGREKNGKTLMSGMNGEELAAALNKLPVTEEGKIGRIGLVGCNIAQQPDQENQQFLTKSFLGDFLKALRAKYGIETTVSARSSLVQVSSSGQKWTAEITPDGIKWYHKDPSKKVLATIDKENNLVAIDLHMTDRQLVHACRNCKNLGGFSAANTESEISNIYVLRSNIKKNKITDFLRVNWQEMDSYLDKDTRRTFIENFEDLVQKAVRKAQSRTIDPLPQGEYEYVSNTGHEVTVRRQGTSKKEYSINVGADVSQQNVFILDKDTGQIRDIRMDHIREVQSYEELVDDINWLGLKGVSKDRAHEYYRFGDWVISFDLRNFYVGTETIGIIRKAGETIRDLAPEIRSQLNAVRHFDPTYANMRGKLGKGYSLHTAERWISGNNLELTEKKNPSLYESCLSMAVFVSESCRNFRTHAVNIMAIDLNQNGKLTGKEFLDNHPMARGGTWPHDDLTGFEGLNDDNMKEVRPKELSFVRLWLTIQTREIGIYSHDCVDELTFEQVKFQLPEKVQNRKESEINNKLLFKIFGDKRPPTEELQPEGASGILGEVQDIKTRSDTVEGSGRSLMMSMALKQDHMYLQSKIKETIREEISPQDIENLQIMDDSLELDGDHLKFKVVKNNDPNTLIELSCKIESEKLKSKEVLDNMNDELSKMEPSVEKKEKITQAHEVMNVYLTISGLGGAIAAFEDGNTVDGAVNLAQSLYGLGAISGLNRRIVRMAGKALSKVFSKSFSKIEAVVSKVAGEDMVKVLDEGIGGVISVGFAVYNVVEDIKRHSTLGYIDAALDIAITITDFLGPEAEPISVALLVIRLSIDDFYNEISKELKTLPPNASVNDKIKAVFEGIGKATVDLWEQFSLPGMIYGAITNSHKLDKEHTKDIDYVNKLSDYTNYFKVEKEEDGGAELINFVDGSTSWKGGSIDFSLLEDGMATLTLEEIPDTSGHQRSVTKHFTLNNDVQDIVVGIGEASSLSWKKITVKFFWFIPVHSKTVISKETNERSSIHGTYHGNSKNNKFFTVQKLDKSTLSKLHYSLGDYFYRLYGGGGNDTFYLGPQKSHVEGGEGGDAYIVPDYGGLTEINNYARDNIDDFLFIDVEFSRIWADRKGQNLVLAHTTDHTITITSWFSDATYRHLRFRANIGVIFEIETTALGQPDLRAVAIDHSNSKQTDNQVIDTSLLAIWSHVVVITGSNFSDTLIGNSLDNHLAGGRGNNLLIGGPGADKYSITKGDGCDTIDNYATDDVVDLLSLDITFDEIEVKRTVHGSVQLHDKGKSATCVTIAHWFVNASYQHLTSMSSDGVVFKISTNSSSQAIITPYLIDLQHQPGPQNMNLSAHAHYDSVLAVVGSRFDDVITGNSKNNFLSGKQGNDAVQGGLGADVYILRKGDGHDVIINEALDRKQDLLLFGCSYNNISVVKEVKDLLIEACAQPPKTNISRCEESSLFSARLQGWFKNVFYQHLVVKSIDGVVFTLPLQQNDAIVKTPVVIDKSSSHTNVTVDASRDEWKTVQRIIGSNSTPSTLIGNQINNIFEVGGPWSYIEGRGGSDTYNIYSGNVSIQNFASDNKTDTVQLQDDFMNLAVQQHEDDLILVRSMKNAIDSNNTISVRNQSVTVLGYKSSPEHQHLIGVTRDGIGFYFANNTYIPKAFMIDKHSIRGRVAINLGVNYTWANVSKVYGAAKGPNHLTANLNPVTLTGGGYPDLLEGNEQDDVIKGGEGEDLIDGQLGNDILVGGPSQDWILGGLGDDLLYPGEGADRVDGGLGRDTIIFQGDIYKRSGVFADLLCGQGYSGDAMNDVYISIENVIGSQFNDILVGNGGNNVLRGRGGNDFLYPHDGNDLLFGDDGADVYVLDGVSGLKMIDNYAKDNMTDVLYIGDRHRESLRLVKKTNDLVIHMGKVHGSYWCPDDTTTVQVTDWYKNEHNQHLSMYLSNTQLSSGKLQNVTNSAPTSLKLSGWEKFVCSVYRFGVGKAVGIAIGIFLAIVLLFSLMCVWKRRKPTNRARTERVCLKETDSLVMTS